MSNLNINEEYGYNVDKYNRKFKSCQGEVEFIIKDKQGRVLDSHREQNIVKIFAKEILSHRVPYSKIWDVNANSGAGGWVAHTIDIDEFALKYITFGASFNEDGTPLDSADTRFYTPDSVVGGYTPITLGVGAEYDGGMINPVPIAEPYRPLKRIERIYFESSYQPSGTPLLQADVRAMNNILVVETTLQKDEYNGFGITSSDFFTLTEVALVGAAEVGSVGSCECPPRDIFLTGDAGATAFDASASGASTITLDSSAVNIDEIKEGDQLKIVAKDSTSEEDLILNQLNPYYLVISKAVGGRDITLDRVPVDIDNIALTGDIGVLRDGFRIFSHRILKTPVKKSEDFEITVRWRIIMN
tara:strand:+ start:3116 stop:4189 length:1074 start_codon:yes stop_codon:yes gene_type:complete